MANQLRLNTVDNGLTLVKHGLLNHAQYSYGVVYSFVFTAQTQRLYLE